MNILVLSACECCHVVEALVTDPANPFDPPAVFAVRVDQDSGWADCDCADWPPCVRLLAVLDAAKARG